MVDGVFTDKSTYDLHDYLLGVARDIYYICHPGASSPPARLRFKFDLSTDRFPVSPNIDTKLVWRLNDGRLIVYAFTRGEKSNLVEFPLVGGKATLQQKLLMLMLIEHPRKYALGRICRELYPNEFGDSNLLDKGVLSGLLKRVFDLTSNLQDKFEKAGIPKAAIPSVSWGRDSDKMIVLNVAAVEGPRED